MSKLGMEGASDRFASAQRAAGERRRCKLGMGGVNDPFASAQRAAGERRR